MELSLIGYLTVEHFGSVILDRMCYIPRLVHTRVYVSVYICSRWFTDIECISRVQTSPTDGRPVTHISSGTMRRDDFGKMCDGRSDGQSLLWLLSRNHKLLIYAASSRVRAQPARYRSNAIKPCVRSTCRENRISGHRRMRRTFLLCTISRRCK